MNIGACSGCSDKIPFKGLRPWIHPGLVFIFFIPTIRMAKKSFSSFPSSAQRDVFLPFYPESIPFLNTFNPKCLLLWSLFWSFCMFYAKNRIFLLSISEKQFTFAAKKKKRLFLRMKYKFGKKTFLYIHSVFNLKKIRL